MGMAPTCGACFMDISRPVQACIFYGSFCSAAFHANCIFRVGESTMVICSKCFEIGFVGDFRCSDCGDVYQSEASLMSHKKACRVVIKKSLIKHGREEKWQTFICCKKDWKTKKRYQIHKRAHGEVKKEKEPGDDEMCLEDDRKNNAEDIISNDNYNDGVPSLTSSFAKMANISVEELIHKKPENSLSINTNDTTFTNDNWPGPNVRDVVNEINSRKNMAKDIEL